MTLKHVAKLAGCSTPVTRAAAWKLFPGKSEYTGAEAQRIADLAREYRRYRMQTVKQRLHERFAQELKSMAPRLIGNVLAPIDEVILHVLDESVSEESALINDLDSCKQRLVALQSARIAQLQAEAAAAQPAPPAEETVTREPAESEEHGTVVLDFPGSPKAEESGQESEAT